MDERKEQHEQQDDERRENPEALEDLDVPEGESDDVKGGVGTYSFKQAWPKKYDGLA